MNKKFITILSLSFILLASCGQDTDENNNQNNDNGNTQVENNNLDNNDNNMSENPERAVQKGDTIAVDYVGTLEDGTQFDSSYDRGTPLEFTVGEGGMIKGFDEGVVGMKVGEKKTLVLSPDEAYGEYSEENIQEVPDSQLIDAGIPLEAGQDVPTQYGTFKIVSVDSENNTVKIDFNHFLAGKTLTFEVELVKFEN